MDMNHLSPQRLPETPRRDGTTPLSQRPLPTPPGQMPLPLPASSTAPLTPPPTAGFPGTTTSSLSFPAQSLDIFGGPLVFSVQDGTVDTESSGLNHYTADTYFPYDASYAHQSLPLFRQSTPLQPFTPSSAGGTTSAPPPVPSSPPTMHLFGQHMLYSGAASSPATASVYPDPVSYAVMPPVSASAMPFSAMGDGIGSVDGLVDNDNDDDDDHNNNDYDATATATAASLNGPPPADTSDWRARLRYCEQALHKASLDASLVRLLEFPEGLDARELADRRAANLRFDRVREQRLKDRNNEAAKRSRQRKVARIEAAEQQVARLRRERARLVGEVASLRRQLAAVERG